MSKNNENKLVPKLRFPEFLKDNEWKEKKLGDMCQYWNGTSHESSVCDDGDYFLISLNSIDIDGNLKSEMKKLSYTDNSLESNDLVMVLSDVAHGNFLGLTDIIPNDSYVLNQRMAGLRIKDLNEVNPQFIRASINKSQKYFKRKGQGSSQLNLSKSAVTEFPVLKPPKLEEQQKIAACLSSLDDVIKAESQKLELLKEHKKGLLQNLFPQEGETVPKLRFKEFEDSGEWEETTISEIGEPLMCKRIFKEETTPNPNNGVPFYKIGTFGRLADSYISKEIYEEYKSKYSFPKVGDILISASGTIGRLVIYDGSPAYFQDSNIIWLGHNEEKVLNRFLFYCYTNLRWQTSDGGVISRLYNSDFKRMTICFPENQKEQEKIADTLSSLDDLINAQSKKIEALKLHKKGLLQGLFPTINYEE